MRIAALIVILGISASNSAKSGELSTTGMGKTTCAEFARLYTEAPAETDRHFLGWMIGFLSGLNYAATTRGETARIIGSEEKVSELLRTTCATHRARNITEAAWLVYASLPKDFHGPVTRL